MLKKLLPMALAAALCLPAIADEASVRTAVEAKLNSKVDRVTKTPYLGLYEIFVGGDIIYTDEKVSALLFEGKLVDTKNMKNITNERIQKLTAIKFSDLPLELAVKQVRGDGKRMFATFEDPNCGYCKKLAKDLTKLDNVTIYTFLYPILSPDSLEKSKQIWCATDKAKAWNDWMVDGKAPTGKSDCDTAAVQKTVEAGRKLAINGTPTIFFADGERIPGAVPVARIEEKLAQQPGK
jgi:thiol:disulfide interchange protein DsbC